MNKYAQNISIIKIGGKMRGIILMIVSFSLMCWADWPVIWDSCGSWEGDVLAGIAIELAGNVTGAGWNRNTAGTAMWHIRQYDPNGNLLWHQQYYTPAGDVLLSTSSDLTGNILVGGYHGLGGIGAEWQMAKYTSNGSMLWLNTYYAYYPEEYLEILEKVASGMWSNYHVAVGLILENYWGASPRIIKIDGDGNILWDRIIDHGSDGFFQDVAIFQETEEIIAAGRLPDRGGGGLVKFDSSGTEILTVIGPDSVSAESSYCRAVVTINTDFIALYITALNNNFTITLIRYDYNGNPLWTRHIGNINRGKVDMATDLNNELWIPLGSYILKYDILGNRLDSIDVFPGMDAVVCRPDTFGNVFIGGTINNPADWIIDRIEPTGIHEEKTFNKESSRGIWLLNNPVSSDYVKISYSLSHSQNIVFNIYNLMGQKVKEFVIGFQTVGQHVMTLNVSDLPAGIYFVRFETGEFKQTEKVILLR